ncbi:MAG: hypothetical protein ACR2NZ_17390 [Rubripirellula sp.]
MWRLRKYAERLRWGTSRLAFLLFAVSLPAITPVMAEAFESVAEVESCEDVEESVSANRERHRSEKRRHSGDRMRTTFAVLAFHEPVPRQPRFRTHLGHRLSNGLLAPLRC